MAGDIGAAAQSQQRKGSSLSGEGKSGGRQISQDRMTPAAFVHGDLLHLTLVGEEQVEEGEQDIGRWAAIGTRLGMHQWIEIVNDAGSMWRLMRVDRIHGSPGTGLRALVLRDVVPPCFTDLAVEPIVKTGDWYVRHMGAHQKWAVITPGGTVYKDQINTEAEARLMCNSASRNRKPI
jgi:hypothetical protein